MNLNRQPGLYRFGMRPVTRRSSSREWARVPSCEFDEARSESAVRTNETEHCQQKSCHDDKFGNDATYYYGLLHL